METPMFDAVILAAGDFPQHPLPASLLNHDRVVCCDSAAKAFIESGRKPWRCIGDGDSLDKALKEQVQFIHEVEQETNDLCKAVRLVVKELGREARIAIIGATGKREDHTLGNISLLAEFAEQGIHCTMYTDFGVFLMGRGTRTFDGTSFLPEGMGKMAKPELSTALSVFNVNCKRLTSQGLKYPIYPFTRLWQGTLNTIEGDAFSIDADGDYLLYRAYSATNEAL